jgi:UDP-N-acetylglucosamine 2-epimerase
MTPDPDILLVLALAAFALSQLVDHMLAGLLSKLERR